jgi:uracil phosphoribosyltransferase
MNQEIQQKIIESLHLEGKNQDEQEKIITELGFLILQAVLVKITDSLSDDQMIRFEPVMASGDSMAIDRFLKDEVKNIDELTLQASKEIIDSYLEG